LVLLSFTVALAQFTALAVEDGTGKTMTAFTAVELNQDAAAIGFVVNVSQQKKSLGDTPKPGDGADNGGGPTAALNGAHESEALRAPNFSEPATRSMSSQLLAISSVFSR
jgi:hypothetical protein